MTLDEAIKHCEEKAEALREESTIEMNERFGNSKADCEECAREHEQLAKWLKELKEWRKLKLICADVDEGICVYKLRGEET